MDFYKGNFAVFALLNAGLAFREYRQVETRQEKDDESEPEAEGKAVLLSKFKWNFIPIYLLVNGADWLQVREKNSGFARLRTYICRDHTSTHCTKVRFLFPRPVPRSTVE
jgi:hypothetical protein